MGRNIRSFLTCALIRFFKSHSFFKDDVEKLVCLLGLEFVELANQYRSQDLVVELLEVLAAALSLVSSHEVVVVL